MKYVGTGGLHRLPPQSSKGCSETLSSGWVRSFCEGSEGCRSILHLCGNSSAIMTQLTGPQVQASSSINCQMATSVSVAVHDYCTMSDSDDEAVMNWYCHDALIHLARELILISSILSSCIDPPRSWVRTLPYCKESCLTAITQFLPFCKEWPNALGQWFSLAVLNAL